MKAAAATKPRRDTLNLRIPPAERNLIDRAAVSAGKTRTDFILEAARRAAEDTLLDRAILSVGPKAYTEFLRRLDAPVAVARSHHGKGIGRALFQDAARRAIHAADAIGIRGLLVHAIDDDAKSFYLRLGLDESPLEPLTPMVTIADLRVALAG